MNRQPAPVSTACRRLHHLVGRRRGEDLAGAGGIEHAVADEARHAAARGRSRRPRSAPPCPASAPCGGRICGPSPSARMSACAAAKPSRLSVSTVSTALMSFFMVVLPIVDRLRSAALAGDAGDPLDEIVDRRGRARRSACRRRDRARSARCAASCAARRRPTSCRGCAGAIGGEEMRRARPALKWQTEKIVGRCFDGIGVE